MLSLELGIGRGHSGVEMKRLFGGTREEISTVCHPLSRLKGCEVYKPHFQIPYWAILSVGSHSGLATIGQTEEWL